MVEVCFVLKCANTAVQSLKQRKAHKGIANPLLTLHGNTSSEANQTPL